MDKYDYPTEKCLWEQMIGDFFFEGINDKDAWLPYICLADIYHIYDIED